jgi:Amidase
MAPNLEPQVEAAVRGALFGFPTRPPWRIGSIHGRQHLQRRRLLRTLPWEVLAYNDVWYGGFTRNPWNLNERSSGSSAGSAAATAGGLCGFSIRDGNARINHLAEQRRNPAKVDPAALEACADSGMDLVEDSLPDLRYDSLMNVVYAETAAAFEGLTLEGADDDLTWQSEDA